MARKVSVEVNAPLGLCKFVRTIRRVCGVMARSISDGSIAKPFSNRRWKRTTYSRPQVARRETSVRTRDARRECRRRVRVCRIGQIIRHGRADRGDDAFLRGLCVAARGFLQRRRNRSRRVCPLISRFSRRTGSCARGKFVDATGGEIIFRVRLSFYPNEIWRMCVGVMKGHVW